MKHIVSFFIITIFLFSCVRVPVTGRKQMNMLPERELIGMSLTNYKEFLGKNPPIASNMPDAQMVQRVGARISQAVDSYMRQNKKYARRIEGYKWEFNLVNEKTVNAWCMPGGKVVVYSGLLPYTQDETGLAVVMGHEISHAIARHGNERMSQMLLQQMGGVALDVALSQKSEETRSIFLAAYGVGTTVGLMLPYSRLHESEADKLGLVFMAMAGYNPELAVGFWERMAKSGGAKPPEFLSTHPGDETRIKQIKAFLPTAMKYYRK